MSLYVAANGILDTHVTWEDVEADLQEKLCTRATFGDNKKAVNISEMKGFLSRIALIEADWQGVEQGKTLPQKFVLKMPSVLPTFEVTKMMNLEGQIGEKKLKNLAIAIKECHNAEVAALKILTKLENPDIPFTKVYSLKPFDEENQLKGYLITEYISNTYNMCIHTSIPADDLIPAIRGLATFSALCELLPVEETLFALGRKGLELHFEEFFEGIDPCKKYDKLRDLFDEDHAEKATKVFLHYHKLLPKYTNIGETLGFKMVLNHGDLWQGNMLCSKSEDGHLKLEALIDWQTVTRVSPGLDLAKVLWGCLSAEDRRERGNELIEFYRDTFTKVYGKELFSFDELLNCYKFYVPVVAIVIVPDMMMFENFDEEKKEESPKEREKLIAMIEDFLVIHEDNMKRFPDFTIN
ncbi:hypothetical protein GCK72_020120 [Caenorhabditis remanei]|uniref:CHK kinase-like domain-containing protein n=1 Tax=Caenorhabditis remanei TaxID=31234 RepID=A0A6A5GFW7_CAERE|nr:hypothetical protein GCK72_020120 [Caenorhabditis remanei]KAF1753563.1 hypothetical protein GCK72_020120 [Caenorhabditis remanei]